VEQKVELEQPIKEIEGNIHERKVELEVQKTMDAMKLKAIHNNIAPRRTGGIPLTKNTLHSYEKHVIACPFFSAISKTMKVF
jgi:hypothetical protein